MLSRVAEKMYWFGRYCERAENTARLVNVNTNLQLDLPRMVKHIWSDTVAISGVSNLFYRKYKKADEKNVVKFMLVDQGNSGSIACSVRYARENARATREIIPAGAWEKINEFHIYVRKNVERAIKQDGRHHFLSNVISFCNQISGFLIGTMSHGDAYNFIAIGRNLERADMTTRIVDVGCIDLLQDQPDIPDAYDNILWMSVLRSLGGYQMYRQSVPDRVNGRDVVDFLLRNRQFPRSVNHCLGELEKCFQELPRNDLPLHSVTRTRRVINDASISKLLQTGLHQFIDEIQVDFGGIHAQVAQTWFGQAPDLNPEQKLNQKQI